MVKRKRSNTITSPFEPACPMIQSAWSTGSVFEQVFLETFFFDMYPDPEGRRLTHW